MFVKGLSEAEAVHLIDYILFGHRPTHVAHAPARTKRACRVNRARVSPVDKYSADNDEFFRSVVLRKRPAKPSPPAPPSTPCVQRRVPLTAPAPSFPRGLCYLVGVDPANRGATMLSLGSYPTVNALLSSWIFNPSSVHLVPQEVGLFHAVNSPVAGSIPVTLCNGDWRVGADNDFPRLPRHPRNDMGPPPVRPRGPPPQYFDNDPRGPRLSDNSARPPRLEQGRTSRGLLDRGAHRGRGRGRLTDPSPFQVQYSDDRRGRDAPRSMLQEKWEDANVTPFEIMIKEMKKSLEDFPRDIAVDTWNDMSAWLKDYLRITEKSR